MAEQLKTTKNMSPVVMGVVAVLVLGVIGAGGYYFLNKESGTGSMVQAKAPMQDETTSMAADDSANPADGEVIGQFGDQPLKSGNPVVARVDGKDITRVDVFRFIQTLPQNLQQLPPQQVYPLALDQVISTRLVQNRAEKAVANNDPELQEQLALAEQQFKRNIYMDRLMQDSVSDADIKKAYEARIAQIPDEEERHARHILVEDEATAKKILEEAKAGKDFGALAKEYSKGPTGPRGGDLGWFVAGDMVPEFSKVVFAAKKGEILDQPVKTQFGWHVVKIEDVRNREKPTLAQMEPALRAQLGQEAMIKKLDEWRDTAAIERFDINGEAIIEPAAGDDTQDSAPAEPQNPAQ